MKKLEFVLGSRSDRAVMVHFFTAMLASNIGRNAYFVCIIWYALTLANSTRIISILLFVSTLSQFLVSGASGYIADVADRRFIVVSMDAARVAIVALTGYAIIAEMGMSVLFFSVALYSMADRGYLTAMQAMIPDLPSNAVTANSASYLMMQFGTFLGAGLAGFLLNFLSYGVALSLISSTFVLSGALLATKRNRSLDKDRIEAASNGRRKYFLSVEQLIKYKLFLPTLIYSFSFGVGILINALLAVYVLNEMNGDAVMFSKFEAAWAVGGVLTCLVLAVGWGSTLLKLGQPGYLLLSGSALPLLWILPLPILVAIVLVVLGVMYNLSRISLDVRVQHCVSTTSIGRARGAINSIATGFGLLVYVLVGIVGDAFLPSHILAGYGLWAIVAVGILKFSAGCRPVYPRSGKD
ncbi:hypothetical protein CN878_22215 [Ochrobactrum sp. 695/2009]|uniref:MFS transporter n=1 Tax=Brucella intermedia TaxID=94625 RepID=A0A7V6PDU7_9HYPH|nr:MFS transporter [Brucella intermedia]PJR92413.1 hypothetical protein CN881_07585 [Ochrobactrum sp. 721/2009]PJT15763.1 hypothetical protein CN880_12380 [Ochrobactrum sp. 720/2009]PJT23875.1 hypothetical protein CN879_08550 [Ochrobactrum sp. 715/2009]PJT24019.1 hypothetical protein CN878_22215 [Ochrobactrum sp. 695/2009]PJT33550.1 hypothetical protein CN877_13890 [Ochrobactrum sp. 689/2009]